MLVKDAVAYGGGKLDVVVHAAGVQSIDDLLLTSDEEIARPPVFMRAGDSESLLM